MRAGGGDERREADVATCDGAFFFFFTMREKNDFFSCHSNLTGHNFCNFRRLLSWDIFQACSFVCMYRTAVAFRHVRASGNAETCLDRVYRWKQTWHPLTSFKYTGQLAELFAHNCMDFAPGSWQVEDWPVTLYLRFVFSHARSPTTFKYQTLICYLMCTFSAFRHYGADLEFYR